MFYSFTLLSFSWLIKHPKTPSSSRAVKEKVRAEREKKQGGGGGGPVTMDSLGVPTGGEGEGTVEAGEEQRATTSREGRHFFLLIFIYLSIINSVMI